MRLILLRMLGLIKPEEENFLRQKPNMVCKSTIKPMKFSTHNGIPAVELDFSE